MMLLLRCFFKEYRWAILSGFLMGSSYVPFPPWAILFCWVPLWLDISREESFKKVFWKAWVSQFVLSLIGFHWIAYTAHEFGYLPWPIAIIVLLLFCSFVHLHIPLALVTAKVVLKKLEVNKWPLLPLATFLLFACAHSLAEILWPAIFPWNLGYPLVWAELSIAQLADIVGVLGLSLGVHFVNAGIAELSRLRNPRTAAISACVFLIFAVFLSFWGAQKKAHFAEGDKVLRVLQVQANIGNLEKVMAEKGMGFQREIVSTYFRLTSDALAQDNNVDLIVWPESAYPDFLGHHNDSRFHNTQLRSYLQKIGKPLVTGGYANDPPTDKQRRDYNGMFLYDADGVTRNPEYHKTYLLAFGEYVPFGEMFPILKKWNPGGPGFGRGSGPITFQLGNVKIGPQVCYESLYPEFSAALVKKGAQILINLTNDSWFGPGFEPKQHMIMTLARGIETRRPLVRSTNTGITTAILADGTQLERSPSFVEWTHVFEIPYRDNPELSFYTRYGNFLPFVILCVAGLIILLGASRTHESRKI